MKWQFQNILEEIALLINNKNKTTVVCYEDKQTIDFN